MTIPPKTKPVILAPAVGLPESRPALPKVKAVRPFGSKILVEVLERDEILGSKLFVGKGTGQTDGAPQAVIVQLGQSVPADAGLAAGQRIYWTGKGTAVEDPNATAGRIRALLEVSNILAIIEEQTATPEQS